MSLPGGIIAAALTPFDKHLRPDASVAIPYYRHLLSDGCDALNVLGTTGEAMSAGLNERLSFMRAVADSVGSERLMVGTGASALHDAVVLTRASIDLGFAAALVIPPFYYRDSNEDGVARFFAELFARVDPPVGSIMLYNFPRMSGYTFLPELVARLLREFPGIIVGLKDSSNTLGLESKLHDVDRSLRIFPGSESLLREARARGFAGCISGSVCLWPQLASRAWKDGAAEDFEELERNRASLSGKPLIGAVRQRVADAEKDPAWLRSIPPL